MKKILRIDLEYDWVLSRIDDAKYPVEVLKDKFVKGKVERVSDSYLHLTLSVDESDYEKLKNKIASFFAYKYGKTSVYALTFSDKEHAEEEIESEQKKEDSKEFTLDDTLGLVNILVGAKEYKSLIKELVSIAPEMQKNDSQDVFMSQSYLFSIGDGCGLSTYLAILARIVSGLSLAKVSAKSHVLEVALDLTDKPKEDLSAASEALSKFEDDDAHVVCFDISKWIDKTDSEDFKKFLKEAQKASKKHVIVFRVPFVDKDVLGKVETSLKDVAYIKTLAFPPFDSAETKEIAKRDFEKYGMTVSQNAWEYVFKRIAEEKSDGKFYGLNTIKKVVKEIVYKKYVSVANGAKNATLIGVSDAKKVCATFDDNSEGMAQLDKLVGCEKIKAKIQEILAQIELSRAENGPDRPCLHMRFVGSPGTGKTTVARILGKILKEKGVLRIGNLYEYKGRDFCGQYIGETAPKTSGMCRDAYGSVLFIDEAYTLYRGDGNVKDYGVEAIDTLISEMENHKNDLVVIMAGYTDDMETLMEANRGLKSRMPYTIEFPNFTREQLFEIYQSMSASKFKVADDLYPAVKEYFLGLSDEVINSKNFSNARFVRNLFERTWAKAAMRSQLEGQKSVTLCANDFKNAASEKDFAFNVEKKIKLGF